MVLGIILAAGKGTRISSNGVNKTALPFNGKPMISYALDLYQETVDVTMVVVGAYADTLREAIAPYKPLVCVQEEQLGTGHAVSVAMRDIAKAKIGDPELVIVGYGDHMMFYAPQTIKAMIANHRKQQAALSLVTALHDEPNALAWGRVIRNAQGHAVKVVEQKDATEAERQVQELNAGFYVFDYAFLKKYIDTLTKSPVSNEYYITDMIERAVSNGYKVVPFTVPFSEVGIGVNTNEQLSESQKLQTQYRNA
ncbi:MAG: NTP transferase domain-containing protein [Candidatus Roizmanbacteria bacterium]|nr:NTP transferase domain-containing protein [Candidatus Roizmanbacteria bacterium]